jgi:hypothetical protein
MFRPSNRQATDTRRPNPAEKPAPIPDAVPNAAPTGLAREEWFRTLVSFLLVVHLFAIGLAITTGNPNGNAPLLMNAKVRAPGVEAYLYQLWLEHGYDYDYIGFMPMFEDSSSMDWPFHLEATINYGSGRKPEVIEIPEPGVGPADRRQRLQQLAKALAAFSQWSEGPQIPDAMNDRRHQIGGSIGAGLLHEHPGAKFVTLRWYYHRGKIAPELRMAELGPWTPTDPRYFATIGNMRVELSPDGRPESMDILPTGEVSPLKSPPGGKGGTSAAATPALSKVSSASQKKESN